MQIPEPREVRQYLREFAEYCWTVVCHYYLLLGGVVIGATVTLFPNFYQGVRVSGWLISVVFIFIATFLVWRSQQKQVARLHNEIIGLQNEVTALQERMRSKILVSCGKKADKGIVIADGQTWYRARLDLQGVMPIPDIEATVIGLLQDGKAVQLAEILTLTMYPGMIDSYAFDKNLKTLKEGTPEFVDVICVYPNGVAVFPVKFCPRAISLETMLPAGHKYTITVAISSPSNRTDICTFEFDWTGDAKTSELTLVSVNPPS
jgi:hypothetical protein